MINITENLSAAFIFTQKLLHLKVNLEKMHCLIKESIPGLFRHFEA